MLQAKTENADAAIDTVQLARYQGGSAAQRAAILADDSAWLAARQPVCAEAFAGGGAAGQVDIAACLLDESTARLDALQGITPPEAVLKATDNTDPRAFSWYTTPKGSRIAMVDTQGDGTGGAVIAWVIIGGADGFVVNPGQFYFSDGSFTDHGVVQPPDPSFHRVSRGPSTSSPSTTATCRPTPARPRAPEATSTCRASRWRSGRSATRSRPVGGPAGRRGRVPLRLPGPGAAVPRWA